MLEKKDKLYTARVYRMWFEETLFIHLAKNIYRWDKNQRAYIFLLFSQRQFE